MCVRGARSSAKANDNRRASGAGFAVKDMYRSLNAIHMLHLNIQKNNIISLSTVYII